MDRPPARTVALTAVVAAVIGAIGPWETTFLGDIAGISGDGRITLILAVVSGLLLLTIARDGSQWCALVGICGLVAAAIGVVDLLTVTNSRAELFGRKVQLVHPGWGLWLTAIAGFVLTGAAVTLWVAETTKKPPAA